MVDNDIESKNISPFIKRIFKKENEITFKNIIYELPKIPSIYFYQNDVKGTNIINSYNDIRSNINKLRITKDFIFSILKTSKSELEKIEIDRNKYLLNNHNLIIKFKNNYTETFNDDNKFEEFKENYDISKFRDKKTKFNQFIEKYLEERNNIFKNIKKDIPYFYTIFQDEYKNSESKTFFINLFKKFSKIRDIILPYINTNNGILGFNMIFDLKDNIYLSDIINIEKEKNSESNEKNNTINYSKYILNGLNIIDNSENNSAKPSTKTSTTKALLKPTKPSLKNKIHKYNLLYLEKYDVNYYTNLQNDNLKSIYQRIINSKDNCIENESPNLYNITINLIELEFSIIEFIFNYIDKNIFNTFINTHIKIKKHIYEQINIFESNYEQYINWYNNVIKDITKFFDTIDINDSDDYENFSTVFDKILNNIDMKYE